MKKLNKIVVLTLLFVFGFVVTSCGDGITGGGSNGDKTVIKYWYANGAQLTTVLEEIKADFEAKNPDYTVELTSYGDYDVLRDTIAAGIASGEHPTAAQTYPDHVALYNKGYALAPLDDYINDPDYGMSAEEQAQFIEGFWAEGTIYDKAGTRYAMPFNKSTELMYYNSDVFAKYNWEVPTTWDEVVTICEAFKQTDEYKAAVAATSASQVFGMGYDSEANAFITFTQQWGATYTSYDANGNGIFNAFGAVESDMLKSKESMNWLVSQFNAGNIATPGAFGAEYCSDAFKNGQCIMTIGSSAGASFNDGQSSTGTKFTTGVAPVPQKDLAHGQVIQQGTNVSLFECTDKDEELGGWLWLKHMVSYESALTWALNTSYFPIRKDVLNSVEYQNHVAGRIVADDGTVLEGKQSLSAKAKQAGLGQANWFYTNLAFKNTSTARDQAGVIVKGVLYGQGLSIDKAYADAYAQVK